MANVLSMMRTQDQNDARISMMSTLFTTKSARMKRPTGVKVSAVSFWGPTRAAWTSPEGAASGALSAAEPVGAADGGRP